MPDDTVPDSPKRVRPLGSGKVGAKQLKRTDRTLCFFMLALQGHDVVVELRAGTFLKGTVYVADVHWNIFLSKVKVIKEGAPAQNFEWMFIKAKSVRMIHLDQNMDYKKFVIGERAQVAAMHAQRKVALLSSTAPSMAEPSDAARPAGF